MFLTSLRFEVFSLVRLWLSSKYFIYGLVTVFIKENSTLIPWPRVQGLILSKKNVGSKKNFGSKNILDPKKIWVQKNSGSRKFWVHKNFGYKINFGFEKFLV